MDVQQVQIVVLHNFHQFTSEDEFIRRILEEWVVRDRDLMVKDIGPDASQPHGLVISNEVHLMPRLRQADSQFSCHYPTPTESGIKNDSDFHRG